MDLFLIFEFSSFFCIRTSRTITITMPACCPPGSWPQLISKAEINKDDAPVSSKGKIVTVGDLPMYVVEPSTGKKSIGAIIVLPDVYSVRVLTPHVRSGDRIGTICDLLADAGYTVALPSIFRDEPFDVAIKGPPDGDFQKFDCAAQDGGVAWFQKQNFAKVGPDVKACAKYLTEKTGGQAIGVVGFCFGTWLLSKSSSVGDVDFSCAVGCHPATMLEKAIFGGDEDEMLNNLKQPTKFLWAGNDSDIYQAGGAGKAFLEKSGGGVEEYPDMLHGWVSRGDVADEKVLRDVKKALDTMLGFFAENMPKV
jgi:dienelactone hydrolase